MFKNWKFVIAWGIVLFWIITVGLFQPPGVPNIPHGFPTMLLIAYFAGTILHWLKKYKEDSARFTLMNWFWENFGGTLSSLLSGLSSLVGTWAMNPAAFPEGNIASYILVLWMGFGADSLNQGGNNKTVPAVVP